MDLRQDVSLLPYNTFGLDATARLFAEFHSSEELQALLRTPTRPIRILGGGSNVLLTRNPDGLILLNRIRGKQIIRRFKHKVWVRFGGGENWHDAVQWAIGQDLGGIENLSLIPGTVGAAPVQNIGAYGVELKDVFVSLKAVDLHSGKLCHFTRERCAFGYRESFFKNAGKGQYGITSVVLSLSLPPHPLHLHYGDVAQKLHQAGISQPGIADVGRVIQDIRRSKLPDPAQIGNCGSFFKNPEIPSGVVHQLLPQHPDMPYYPLPGNKAKIPAGWLIEQCGWKGKRIGNTGCYEKQALVLVNHGGATGAEVARLAAAIIDSVQEKFGIELAPEVNIW